MVSFCVLFGCCIVVNTSAVDCLERLVPEMTRYVSSGTLSCIQSLTQAHKCNPCALAYNLLTGAHYKAN